MAILGFIINITGAVMLLLYAVRMVQTGIDRAFGYAFKRLITRSKSKLMSAGVGLSLALILQSSIAVTMLVSSFTSNRSLKTGAGIAIVLGADLGSALLIQVLSFDLTWMVPVLLAVGGGFFLKSDRRQLKQAGRISLGIALILISLSFLRAAVGPILDSTFLPTISGYLAEDLIAAFIVGVVLAFVMHSSLAAILLCVTFVSAEVVSLTVGLSLVLGANFGSALIPIWLTRSATIVARRVPLGNFFIRGSCAILVLGLISQINIASLGIEYSNAQSLIFLHVGFNLILLIFLPFCAWIGDILERSFVESTAKGVDQNPDHKSLLTPTIPKTANLALSNLKCEILRMLRLVQFMAEPVMASLCTNETKAVKYLVGEDKYIDAASDVIRAYVSAFQAIELTPFEYRSLRELTEYAFALERSGDIIAHTLIPRILQTQKAGVHLSPEGLQELQVMHERLIHNIGLASNLLISDDVEIAKLLLEEKNEMSKRERASQKFHFDRISLGNAVSIESSSIHLEILHALGKLNGQISTVAYPFLAKAGLLLESRLATPGSSPASDSEFIPGLNPGYGPETADVDTQSILDQSDLPSAPAPESAVDDNK